MKTDRYLNLCLEQAANSTLRHRHGCIVVKGGKVIGQGFNDPRPGFDGGLPSAASIDNGRSSDQSLSMHSEMMAIHSVLSSSASATTAKAERRIARDLKRDRGMRREAVNSRALNPADAASLNCYHGKTYYEGNKHYHQKAYYNAQKYGQKNPKHYYEAEPLVELGISSTGTCQRATRGYEPSRPSGTARKARGKSGRLAYTAPGDQCRTRVQSNSSATAKPVNFPLGKTSSNEPVGVMDRWKHSKLHGADIYVARLSRCGPSPCQHPVPTQRNALSSSNTIYEPPSAPIHLASITGSLFDEITCQPKDQPPTPQPKRQRRGVCTPDPASIAIESRPCYRCVLFMHSVGIRRVFWTDKDGQWHGSKVRALVEMLEQGIVPSTTEAPDGLFVTKHEVLRLYMSRHQSIAGTLKSHKQ
ncbi:hypothetical protein B0T11DRAFT_316305 [Plectosphaerella cucumerina]|uniref:CMP/dCMP-type deaminase domain-containing protein n=1 Tax=Plectosphaerella cucumerina TaxID=40658 RepID=A0A8K0TJ08_9PEZI|nr:hypothetical protein B0T11DRAFT_316305 [Plectosphaerella cucumerina]